MPSVSGEGKNLNLCLKLLKEEKFKGSSFSSSAEDRTRYIIKHRTACDVVRGGEVSKMCVNPDRVGVVHMRKVFLKEKRRNEFTLHFFKSKTITFTAG